MNSLSVLTDFYSAYDFGRLIHVDIQFPLGKELVKSRMEAGNRGLFSVYGCKT